MPIDKLTLENVATFKYAQLDFASGVNVFLGPNGTGKSIAMRALYSLAHTIGATDAQALVHLTGCLHPEGARLARIVRNRIPNQKALISVQLGDVVSTCKFGEEIELLPPAGTPPPGVFLPTLEIMSIFRGLLPEIERRDLDFDTTVADLCLALQTGTLIGEAAARPEAIAAPLEKVIGGKVALVDGRFVIATDFGELEPHLLGEGLRRLGVIVQLVRNGAIAPGSVLFWDEPETNMNPRLIRVVAELLLRLAKSGVQVFVATHDFLLSGRLSLHAEYEAAQWPPITFFGFSRKHEDDSVHVQDGKTLADLPDNPIVEAFSEHYDLERKFFIRETSGT